MNVRKDIDYSELFEQIDAILAAELPQMETCREIGCLIAGRAEKGAAVVTAEYIQRTHPDISGFSPRNVRRMREFYLAYGGEPEAMMTALMIGWTQNVVILEADLTPEERTWYIRAVHQFGWSKLALMVKIEGRAHEQIDLDTEAKTCYTDSTEQAEESYDEDTLCVSREHLPQPDGGVRDERHGLESGADKRDPRLLGGDNHRGDRKSRLSSGPEEARRARYQLRGRLRYPDYEQHVLIIGMDRENLEYMRRICLGDPEGKIHLLMDYTDRPGDVADPWYTRDFEATWRDVDEGCQGLLAVLRQEAH